MAVSRSNASLPRVQVPSERERSGSTPPPSTTPQVPLDALEAARPGPLSFLEPVVRTFQPSSEPTPLARQALQSATKRTNEYYLFTPPAGQPITRGLVFLGGAKVQEAAYAPLAKALAERGIATAIVRSPFELPFVNSIAQGRLNQAAQALRELDPTLSLIVGGHSAGGFVASGLRGFKADDLLLLNSRATGSTRADVSGLAIFGGRDGLIDSAERTQTQQVLPSLTTVVLDLLDHDFAQGLYGSQSGDPVTNASTQALIDQVADLIAQRLGRVSRES